MAGVPDATNARNALQKIIKEEISPVRKELEPEVDAVFSRMYDTSREVQQGIGRAWQVIHTFETGVAGGFHNIANTGPVTDPLPDPYDAGSAGAGEFGGQSHIYSATQARTFPGLGETTNPAHVQKTISLVQGMGCFHLPFQYFMADKLPASIMDSVSATIRGTAKNVNQSEANSFYATSTQALMTIPDEDAAVAAGTVADGAISDRSVKFTIDGVTVLGRIARFYPGMMLDLMATDGTTVSNGGSGQLGATPTGLVVMDVDYINKAVTIGTTVAVEFAHDSDIVDADYFVNAGNLSVGPSGAEAWLKSSGTVFGISLTQYPQLKSLLYTASAPLDGILMNLMVGGFYEAYGGMYGLDSCITTTGVYLNWIEQTQGLGRYELNNNRLTLKEGWSSMGYAYNGEDFQLMASRYQMPGQAYIMKLGNQNLKRYTPPQVSETGSRSEFRGGIQFVAPWMGSSSIFMPALTTSALVTEMVQAPFLYFREWCPDQIPGIFASGLTESNIVPS